MELDGLVPRGMAGLLEEQVLIEPVIVSHGPRPVGKSTVLRGFAEAVGGSRIDLDDLEVREAVQGNRAASMRAGAPVCIDEYQRVPDALKVRLNREGSRPGTAIITGYTRQDALAATVQKLGVSRLTAENHLRLLEGLFLIVRLPAWGKTLRSCVSAKPKVHVVDSGLAARLLRFTPDKLAGVAPTSLTDFGRLLEIFVVGELRKQASWLDEPVALGHWRTSSGVEVDLVIEYDDGRVVAFEVKASERAPGKGFNGMAQFRALLGERFIGGILLTTGSRSYTYEKTGCTRCPSTGSGRPCPPERSPRWFFVTEHGEFSFRRLTCRGAAESRRERSA